MSASLSIASRLWSRTAAWSRDSWKIGSAFAREIVPLLRRQKTELTVGGAFRNVIVTQARQSNQVATSVLSVQQQIGLMRYHGFMGYWRQRQGLLQQAGGDAPLSTIAGIGNNNNKNAVQVAFMITSSMRKELSENLGYTAEQIKSMTPLEASLILHHKVSPAEKEQELQALVQAHKAEQERIQKEQEQLQAQRQLLEEKQAKEKADALAAKPPPAPSTSTGDDTLITEQDPKNQKHAVAPAQQEFAVLSSQNEPNEGVFKLDDSTKSSYSLDSPPRQKQNPTTASAGTNDNEEELPFGSFVASMEEQADSQQDWYEVVESRLEDKSTAPVGLFSNLKEAEMAMDLKRMFAERRAREDIHNEENIPVTTYSIRKTIK